MIIGIFVLYIHFLPQYDLDIRPWRWILLNQPQIGTLSKNEDMEMMQNLWNQEETILLERLKKDILSEPNLERSYPYRRFYIKIYCYNNGMGAVLLQEDKSWEAKNPEAQ